MEVAKHQSALWSDGSWTSHDGLMLHYRDYPGRGDRPPLLMLHGLTRNCRDFEELAPRYAGQWRVLAPDFRGRGLSDCDADPGNYAPGVYAADIIQLLDRLDIDRAIFIGTSLGGLVTMAVAALAPQRIAAAVLNDIGPQLERPGLERINAYVGMTATYRGFEEAAAAIAERNADLHPGYGAAEWLHFARRICRTVEQGVVFDYDIAIAENFRRSLIGPAFDAWPFYRALAGLPVLILRAENSDLLSRAVAERMRDELACAELVEVPGVGHPPDLGEPEAVAAIDRLLDRLRD